MLVSSKITPHIPVRDYPPKLKELFQEEALGMLGEMESRKLEVKLVTNKKGKHRETENTNPEWYSQLWHQYSYPTTNKNFKNNLGSNTLERPSSTISRPKIMKSLQRVIDGKDWSCPITEGNRARNDFELRRIILANLIEGYEVEGHSCSVPARLIVDERLDFAEVCEFDVSDDHSWDLSPGFPCVAELPKIKIKGLNMSVKSGLYFLFHKNELVYIGVSNNIHRRIKEHNHTRAQKENYKTFDSFTQILFSYSEALEKEREYIAYYLPKHNKVYQDAPENQTAFNYI